MPSLSIKIIGKRANRPVAILAIFIQLVTLFSDQIIMIFLVMNSVAYLIGIKPVHGQVGS